MKKLLLLILTVLILASCSKTDPEENKTNETEKQSENKVDEEKDTIEDEEEKEDKEEEIDEPEPTKKITLTEANFEEKDMLLKLWQERDGKLFPTDFPEEVQRSLFLSSGLPDSRDYGSTYFFGKDPKETITISFSGYMKNKRLNKCSGLKDLELQGKINGNEFYYGEDDDLKIGTLVTDEFCYDIETEYFDEDNIVKLFESLEQTPNPDFNPDLEPYKFPTLFPSMQPEITNVIANASSKDETFTYKIYYDHRFEDTDISLDYDIRKEISPEYKFNEDTAVSIDGFEEAYFETEFAALRLFDGNFYYHLSFVTSEENKIAFGRKQMNEALIKIAESLK